LFIIYLAYIISTIIFLKDFFHSININNINVFYLLIMIENTNKKPKALLFLPYLAPYRVDALNEIGKYYDLTVIFLLENMFTIKFDQKELRNKLKVKHTVLTSGFNYKKRQIRFGIYKLIKQHQPDVIFSNEYGLTSLLISLFQRLHLFHFKHIATTSDNVYMTSSSHLVRKIARKFVLNSAQGIIVYNQETSDWYKDNFKKLIVKICPNIQRPQNLLNSGDELEQISKTYLDRFELKNKKIYLYVGRLATVKGLDQLIEIFNTTKQPDEILILIGDGPQKEEVKELINRLELNNTVLLPGRYQGNELNAWYKIANLFILPSFHEPFGAVINESLIFGIPVLCSSFAGATYFIKEKENGLIFDPTNKKDFIEKFNEARKIFSNFNIEKENLMNIEFEFSLNSYYTLYNEIKVY